MRVPAVTVLFFAATLLFLAAPIALRPTSDEPQPNERTVAAPDAPIGSLEVDFLTPYFALDPSASVDGAIAPPAFDPASPFGGLPQSEGSDVVAAACSSCHSLQVVMQQSLTREAWDATLDTMVAARGMAELDPADRTVVLDYLARQFSPQPARE